MKKYTKETFLAKAIEIHGDTYNYDNSKLINSKIKIEIICKKHQIFFQTPEKHLQGQGCPSCNREESRINTINRNLKNRLKIDLDWLKEKYINENLSQKEIAKILNTKESTISGYIIKYGIFKDKDKIKQKTIETNLKKFGTNWPAENLSVKNKMIKTSTERYGTNFPAENSEIREKIKKTMILRWNCEYPIQNIQIKNKIKNTMLSNWGVEYPIQNLEIKNKIDESILKKFKFKRVIQNPEYKDKIKKTNIDKYGVEYPVQSIKIKDKIKNSQISNGNIITIFEKTISEWGDKYNVNSKFIYHLIRSKPNLSKNEFISIIENYKPYQTDIESLIVEKLKLSKWDKKFYKDLNYKPDFKISDKIALNVDGLYWHSEENKTPDYHFKMRKNYEKLGLRIFQFRANEIFNKLEIISSMINNSINLTQNKIGARKTKIMKIDQCVAKKFLNDNHIKGYKTSKHFGLIFNEELVSIMSYKIGRKNELEFLKIERFCSKINFNVIGAFSKLLKHIEKEYVKIPIHYWVDLRYGTGNFLLEHGFSVARETLGWDWTDNFKVYNRLQCRANMDDRCLSEKEHAKELGWHKIWDAGQRLYIK